MDTLRPDRVIGDLAFLDELPDGYAACDSDCTHAGPFLYRTTEGWEVIGHGEDPDTQRIIALGLAYDHGVSIHHPAP